jgi:hypothetical protein
MRRTPSKGKLKSTVMKNAIETDNADMISIKMAVEFDGA